MKARLSIVLSALLFYPLVFQVAYAHSPMDSQNALKQILQGNERFAHNQQQHPHQKYQQLLLTRHSQHPVVAVLACSDSRVAPEIIFDQGIGDIFDVRVAGNIADASVLGSLEYAVQHLHVPLIIVLGHQHCGAVEATLAHEHPHNHINHIIRSLAPATHHTEGSQEKAEKNNIERVIQKLSHDNPLKQEIHAGRLVIIGAYYHLDTGQVELLSSNPMP